MIPLALLLSFFSSAPSCDAPEVRSALLKEWTRMASQKSDTLQGSEVKAWNLRPEGKTRGDCLADFLARRPGASIGGTIPFRITSTAGGFRIHPRGEPRLTLLQADSAKVR